MPYLDISVCYSVFKVEVYLGIRPSAGVSPRGLVSDNPSQGANAPREGLSDTDPRADTKPRI